MGRVSIRLDEPTSALKQRRTFATSANQFNCGRPTEDHSTDSTQRARGEKSSLTKLSDIDKAPFPDGLLWLREAGNRGTNKFRLDRE